MSHRYFWILCLLMGGFFSACEKEIQLDLPQQEKLVVFSNFTPDSLFRVYLSTATPKSNANSFPLFPQNASIQLYENESLLGDCTLQNTPDQNGLPHYTLNAFPKEEASYRLEVSVPNYPSVKAKNTIPKVVAIERLERKFLTEEKQPYDNESIYFMDASLRFTPQTEEAQYFHLIVYREVVNYTVWGTDTIKNTFRETLELFPPKFEHTPLFYEPGFVFQNTAFKDSRPAIIDLSFQFNHYPDNELKSPIYFELRHVSEDYYLFQKSLEEQDISAFRQSLLFSEPVLVYNNIEQGIGNFSGYSAAIDSLYW